jgi:hypothetical protein
MPQVSDSGELNRFSRYRTDSSVGFQIIFTQRGLIFSEWFERKGL